MARERELRVSFKPGGWLAVDGAVPGDLYVRVLPDSTGRLRVRELYIDATDAEPITTDSLKDLPLSDIEAMANLDADDVTNLLRLPGGDRMSILASYLGTAFGTRRSRLDDNGATVKMTLAEQALENWVVASWLASHPEDARKDSGLAAMCPPAKARRRKSRGFRDIDYRLDSGPGRVLDDDFMRRLARAYRAAVARGESPNVAIAQSLGYPVARDKDGKPRQQGLRTVQSWVYEARKRGYLPPARKGAAG